MEIWINILAGFIYLAIFIGCIYSSYFFWLSVDGELRLIMIRKYLCAALIFLTLATVHYFATSYFTLIVSISCIPYAWQKYRLVKFLVRQAKVKDNKHP